MTDWIDEGVNPAPPDTPVLIFDGENIAVGIKQGLGHGMAAWYIAESYGFSEDGGIPRVYFWMELPAPPQMPDVIEAEADVVEDGPPSQHAADAMAYMLAGRQRKGEVA